MLTCRVNPTLHPRRETSGNADIPIGGFFSLSSFSFFCFPVSAFPKSYPFYFHALPHSFALAFLLKPLESSNSALFAQNTGGGGYPLNSIFIFPSALWVVSSRRVSPFPSNTCKMHFSQPLCFANLACLMGGGTPLPGFPNWNPAVPSLILTYFVTSLPHISFLRCFLFFKPDPQRRSPCD